MIKKYDDPFQIIYSIKLDSSGNSVSKKKQYLDLEYKHLTSKDQVNAEIKNILKNLDEINPKIPEKIRKILPTHFELVKQFWIYGDKLAYNEYS